MAQYQGFVKGTDTSIQGTSEKVYGVALCYFNSPDAKDFEYTGETKIDWNTQKMLRNDKDEIIFIDSDGYDRTADEIEFR